MISNNKGTYLSSDVDVSILMQQGSYYFYMATSNSTNQHRVTTLHV